MRVRVFTVDDGLAWICRTAVEHWHAECVGWHVCKRGEFAALQPISMGLAGLYGSTAAGAARGLASADRGSRLPVSVMGPLHQPASSGASSRPTPSSPSPRPTASPSRFNRTLKEQIIHGRIYRNFSRSCGDASSADFVELYNAQWIVEKNGYLSPAQARQATALRDLDQARRVRPCVRGTGCGPAERKFAAFLS